jgi:hypothetical protein
MMMCLAEILALQSAALQEAAKNHGLLSAVSSTRQGSALDEMMSLEPFAF